MPTKEDLKYYQAMPLALKIKFSFQRMREWVIDWLVAECQQMGIETRTPDEIANMLSLWKGGER